MSEDKTKAEREREREPATKPKPKAKAQKPEPKTLPKEVGGPPGPEPTRYGDWQYKGRVTDF